MTFCPWRLIISLILSPKTEVVNFILEKILSVYSSIVVCDDRTKKLLTADNSSDNISP